MPVIMTVTVPKAFKDGPEFDEEGDLVPGSWPTPFPTEGILSWHPHGDEVSGRVMVDTLLTDEAYPEWETGIPNGWTNAGHHKWDMHKQDEYDEDGNFVSSGLDTLSATDQSEYKKHQPDDLDENGNPILTEYRRIHKYLGWPDVRD